MKQGTDRRTEQSHCAFISYTRRTEHIKIEAESGKCILLRHKFVVQNKVKHTPTRRQLFFTRIPLFGHPPPPPATVFLTISGNTYGVDFNQPTVKNFGDRHFLYNTYGILYDSIKSVFLPFLRRLPLCYRIYCVPSDCRMWRRLQ
jgi:hypothetical protein